ncbi:hypothetical protein FB451DRAFT_1243879 [Mycena latifolia]|nr:hypothetical protein FB451DRAFT_1243879 [Mycena latifolia]
MEPAPRGSASILQWLPNETVAQIIQAAPCDADRVALCGTSKLFYGLGLPVLYRSVRIQYLASIEAFCSAVLSNPALAEHVRSFTITNRGGGGDLLWFHRISAKILHAVKTLLRIEHLSIPIFLLSGEPVQELLGSTFPHLLRCSLGTRTHRWSSTERKDTLASFLIRHPALETLHIQYWGGLEAWPSASGRIPLPHLERLRCPSKLIFCMETSGLKEASLYWEDNTDAVETILALKSMIRPDVPFVCSNSLYSHHDFAALVDVISKNLPQTTTLHLSLHRLESRDDKLNHLRTCLPRFAGLVFLWIEARIPWASEVSEDSEQDERITVQRFGNVCPTLHACCFYERGWRKVGGMWEVFSVEDFKALSGISLH